MAGISLIGLKKNWRLMELSKHTYQKSLVYTNYLFCFTELTDGHETGRRVFVDMKLDDGSYDHLLVRNFFEKTNYQIEPLEGHKPTEAELAAIGERLADQWLHPQFKRTVNEVEKLEDKTS